VSGCHSSSDDGSLVSSPVSCGSGRYTASWPQPTFGPKSGGSSSVRRSNGGSPLTRSPSGLRGSPCACFVMCSYPIACADLYEHGLCSACSRHAPSIGESSRAECSTVQCTQRASSQSHRNIRNLVHIMDSSHTARDAIGERTRSGSEQSLRKSVELLVVQLARDDRNAAL
jgi:hypothetical protein